MRGAIVTREKDEAKAVSAFIEEQTTYPDNLSLAFLPASESQTVVFYLTMALSGSGSEDDSVTELTITSANANYASWARMLTLTVTALRTPEITVVKGTVTTGSSYPAKRQRPQL